MNFLKIMNLLAWGLSAIIFLWLMVDFIRAEKEIKEQEKETNQGKTT